MKVRTEVSAATLRSSEVATSLRSTSKTAARRDRNASLTATFAGLLALLLLPVGWTSVQAATAAGGAKAKVHQAPARSARTFSLDFIDTDVVDVLKALSTQSGANIVATGGVKGKTTLSLRNVTMEEALRLVCASAGLDYAWADTAYVVGTPEEMRGLRVKELSSRTVVLHQVSAKYAQEVLKQAAPDITVSYQDGASAVVLLGTGQSLSRAERILAEIDVPSPPTSKMYWLAHASAEKVTDLLTKAVPEATVQPGPQQNSLVITADSVRMAQAESLIKEVDVVPSASQAYVVIYEIKYAHADELRRALTARFPDLTCVDAPRTNTPVIQQPSGAAGVTTSLLAAPQAAGGGGGVATSQPGASTLGKAEVSRVERLLLMGAEYTVQRAVDFLQQVDVPSKQVKIKAIITRINRDKLRQLGIDWFTREGAASSGILSPINVRENPVVPGESSPGDSLLFTGAKSVGRLFRTQLDFVGAIKALESKGDAKVLSEPNVTTLDGRQVAFHSGQKIFFQTTIGFGISGTPILDIREIDVGVTLLVTPQVNPEGDITLTLSPTVSSASFRQELGTALPIVDERTAIASVRVKQGESLVIAGLVEDTETINRTQVPLLGSIPILGKFFQSEKKQHTTDELVIMVQPEVVK